LTPENTGRQEEDMKKALPFIVFAILGAVLLIGGCSDSTKPAKTPGSENDASYQTAQAFAKEFVDSLPLFASDGFSYMDFDGTKIANVLSDSASINYDGATKWWVIYFHHDSTYANLTARDSVRFEQGDSCTMFPDSLNTTGIDYRATLDISLGGDTVNVSADFGNGMHITGIQSEQVNFDGPSSAAILTQLGVNSSIECVYSAALNNVVFNCIDLETEIHPHPVDGTIAMAMMVHTVAPQGSAEVNWTIDITFYADHYHVHFESGDNYWDWDGTYIG
jgi:hypothetical protein